jgi:hypothetical protein
MNQTATLSLFYIIQAAMPLHRRGESASRLPAMHGLGNTRHEQKGHANA